MAALIWISMCFFLPQEAPFSAPMADNLGL